MKKKNVVLEKRIFVLFFLLSFLLVIILVFIEWQLAKYGIKQVEENDIQEITSKFSSHLHQLRNEKEALFNSLLNENRLTELIRSGHFDQMNIVIENVDIPDNIYLSIFDRANMQVWGEDWDFTNEEINVISRNSTSNYYVSSYGNKFYFVCYKEIIHEGNELGFLVTVEELDVFKIPLLTVEGKYYLISYPIDNSSFYFDNNLAGELNSIYLKLDEAQLRNESEFMLRLSAASAYGFKIFYRLENPSALFVVQHPRTVYNFGQQSVLLFILIIFAITILLIIFLGNWFSKTILLPINTINSRMIEISANPSRIEPLKKNYRGVLGEMLNTFNLMNRSINKYSENLRDYKLISDNLDSGFFWLDENLKITMSNNSLFSILDIYSSENLLKMDLIDLLQLNDNHLSQLRKEGLTLHEWQINTGKNRKYVLIKIMPLLQNERLKFIGNITDITPKIEERTARQALELELIKSNKLAEIGRRIEGIIHNINSPLNTVLGYAQLLKKNQPENVDLDKIMSAGKSISHIVKGVLNKTKLDSSSMIRSISINELIEQELELCNHNLFFKHYVELKKNLDKNLPDIQAVYGDISLCLANILNNAIEALEKSTEKKIWVKTYLQNEELAIEIKDSGEGIQSKNLDIIFEPYFTTKNKPGDKGSGFGLGLAISKNIVTRYNGRIKSESKFSQGSIFTILLPIHNNLDQ